MKIEEEKTKSIIISHDQLRCKLVINDRIIEQVMQIDYLGTRFTSNSRGDEEIDHQLMKARIAGSMNNFISVSYTHLFNNKCMNIYV